MQIIIPFISNRLDKNQVDELPMWPRTIVKVCTHLITKYPFIHKIDKVFLNMKTKEVTVEVNQKQVEILTTRDNMSQKYLMNQQSFDQIKQILNQRKI